MAKSKPKFRVGQVVCLPKGPCQSRDRYGRVTRNMGKKELAVQTTDGYWYALHVRALTIRERGSRA